jgi:hypothetical protein
MSSFFVAAATFNFKSPEAGKVREKELKIKIFFQLIKNNLIICRLLIKEYVFLGVKINMPIQFLF